jgi:hypothetical protein
MESRFHHGRGCGRRSRQSSMITTARPRSSGRGSGQTLLIARVGAMAKHVRFTRFGRIQLATSYCPSDCCDSYHPYTINRNDEGWLHFGARH